MHEHNSSVNQSKRANRLRDSWTRATPAQRVRTAIIGIVCAAALVAATVCSSNAPLARVNMQTALDRQAELVELYGFDPGNIISQHQFFDRDAMSEHDIQSFLNEQGEACTGKECLKNATFTVANRKADRYCNEYVADKSHKEHAASIIYKTQQACAVSAKVLLTMLQKEQQLVTAANPTAQQYRSAMGLSCPDDKACDTAYAGFFNQVFGSAQRYQYYVHHENEYGYHAHALNYVRFNPDPACGGTDVYIHNRATALLYIYTPYQPNTAALAAGAGEGDACSTYGNRNFSLIYQGWFGDPRVS